MELEILLHGIAVRFQVLVDKMKEIVTVMKNVQAIFSHQFQSIKLCSVKKDTKLNQVSCLIKSSETMFIFYLNFIWYYGSWHHQRILKKIPILKTWQMVFFWGIKTYFGILPLKWCIFRHEKMNIFSKICHSFRPN